MTQGSARTFTVRAVFCHGERADTTRTEGQEDAELSRNILAARFFAGRVRNCRRTGQPALVRADDEIPGTNPLSGDEKRFEKENPGFVGVCALCHGGRADDLGSGGTGADCANSIRASRLTSRPWKKGTRGYRAASRNAGLGCGG